MRRHAQHNKRIDPRQWFRRDWGRAKGKINLRERKGRRHVCSNLQCRCFLFPKLILLFATLLSKIFTFIVLFSTGKAKICLLLLLVKRPMSPTRTPFLGVLCRFTDTPGILQWGSYLQLCCGSNPVLHGGTISSFFKCSYLGRTMIQSTSTASILAGSSKYAMPT